MPLRVVSLLLLVLAGCPGKDKDKPTDDDGDDDADVLPPPSVKLIVGGIDPSYAAPAVSFGAEVFGSGFQKGATVTFSGEPAEQVRFNDSSSLAVTVPALQPGRYDVTVVNPEGAKASLRGGLTVQAPEGPSCRSITVYFEFDSASLAGPVREQLDGLANCLSGTSGSVEVQGHCDERGTTEYNLSLGQRRAESVARYLQGVGVNPGRLRAVSYGEERPAVQGSDPDAWAANRRAELILPE